MIIAVHGTHGSTADLDLVKTLGPRCELEGFCFCSDYPLEWRLCCGEHRGPWMPGDDRFHDLQSPNRGGGTGGLSAKDVRVETRGMLTGQFTLLVWPREGTYTQARNPDANFRIVEADFS